MAETIEQRVLRVIATSKRLPLEKVRADSTFEELGVDSLDRLNILFDLEGEFDVEIDDEEARKVTNIHEMVAGIEILLSRKAGGAPVLARAEEETGADDLPESAAAPETPGE